MHECGFQESSSGPVPEMRASANNLSLCLSQEGGVAVPEGLGCSMNRNLETKFTHQQ